MPSHRAPVRSSPLRPALLASILAVISVCARADTFALTIYETPAAIAARTSPAEAPAYWESYAAFAKAMQDAGVLRGGSAFHTGDRVQTVTLESGKSRVKPGAHAKAREEVGGYFVIEVASLDEALAWAARAPSAASGAVEVRSYYPAPGMK